MAYCPTATQFRAFLKAHGLTGAAAAELVGVKPRQIRRYTGGDTPVPYAVWFTLHVKITGNPPPHA